MGKILRVDLTKQTIQDESLPAEHILRKYIGGSGLGLKYLYDEVAPSVAPLDPDSRLVIMTGPLGGTVWPCSSRHAFVNLFNACPKEPGTSAGGGFWAAKLKWAGYDGIIVQGKSSEPVFILIQNGKPVLRDARHLWGKETRETENLIRKELGDPQCSAACIGPAGERCLPGSIVLNDQNHASAKSGAGELMGSKLLKAIAISGRGKPVPLADVKKLTELALEFRKGILDSPSQRRLAGGGSITRYDKYPPFSIAYKNWSDELGGSAWIKEVMDVVRASQVIPRPCFNCPIGCAQDIIVGKGPYKGYRSRGGGGGQWGGTCAMIGVMEGSTVIYLTDLANRLGIETGIMGGKMGLLYECYEKGMISKDFTDGLELNWGNADAAVKLLYKYVNQEGIGKLLAKGQEEIAKTIGKGAEQFLGGWKGLTWHWDNRRSWESLLGHVVSTFGIAGEGRGFDTTVPDAELGYTEIQPPFDRDRAPVAVQLTAMKYRWEASLGICYFLLRGGGSMDCILKALNLTTGWDFDREEAFSVGKRAMNLARVFSLRRGLTIQETLHMGPRFLDGHKVAEKTKDKPIRPHLEKMVKEFYGRMGWDAETGIPSEDTLKSLGLDELIDEVRKLKPRPVESPTSPTGVRRKPKEKVSKGKKGIT